MGESVHIMIPGTARKNASHRAVQGRVILSKRSREFRRLVHSIAIRDGLVGAIDDGRWAASIRAYWPQLRHLDVDVPKGDVDAPVSAVLDALERAGVIDNDARIVSLTATNHHDKQNPRIEVSLARADTPAKPADWREE